MSLQQITKYFNRHFVFCITLFVFILRFEFFSQNYRWSKSFGGTGDDGIVSVMTDQSGNVYTYGGFTDTVDFDPGPGVVNLVSSGMYGDGYVLKLDSLGNFVWVRKLQCTGLFYPTCINVDAAGDVVLCGFYTNVLDANPGPASYNMGAVGNGYSSFIIKLNNVGNFVWANTFGAWGYSCFFNKIVADANNNIHVTGVSIPTGGGPGIDFNPGQGVDTITSTIGVGPAAVLIKFDPFGNLVWVRGFIGLGGNIGAVPLAVDKFGNVYSAGYFTGTVDFDPGINNFYMVSTANGLEDVFVSKLDALGNFVWAKAIKGTMENIASGLALDTVCNVFVAGYFRGITDFDPGLSTASVASNGGSDFCLTKLDSSGNFIWNKTVGGPGHDECFDLILDNSDKILVAGYFNGTVDFDPGPGIVNMTTLSPFRSCILKLDIAGNFVWVKSIDGINTVSNSFGGSLNCDLYGNIYATGGYQNTVDLNPDFGTLNVTSAGTSDVYILKLGSCNVNVEAGSDIMICAGESALLSTNGVYAYNWSSGIPLTPSIVVNPSVTTSYALTGSLSDDCFAVDSVSVIVDICTNNPENKQNEYSINVYPNPNQGQFYITTTEIQQVLIINSIGQLIEKIVLDEKNEFKGLISGLSRGIYFITTNQSGRKIVVE